MKQRKEIKNVVIAVLIDKLGCDENELTEETHIEFDLGADSLDFIELIMEFEDKFNTDYKDDDVEEIRTVKEIINFILENPYNTKNAIY